MLFSHRGEASGGREFRISTSRPLKISCFLGSFSSLDGNSFKIDRWFAGIIMIDHLEVVDSGNEFKRDARFRFGPADGLPASS
jgi:hypothetical protein